MSRANGDAVHSLSVAGARVARVLHEAQTESSPQALAATARAKLDPGDVRASPTTTPFRDDDHGVVYCNLDCKQPVRNLDCKPDFPMNRGLRAPGEEDAVKPVSGGGTRPSRARAMTSQPPARLQHGAERDDDHERAIADPDAEEAREVHRPQEGRGFAFLELVSSVQRVQRRHDHQDDACTPHRSI